jgi:hypothetical protein
LVGLETWLEFIFRLLYGDIALILEGEKHEENYGGKKSTIYF